MVRNASIISHRHSAILGDYLDRKLTREAVQPFNDLAKFTLLSICLSSSLSYVIFIVALIKHYYKDHWNHFRNCRNNCREYQVPQDNQPESQLHPFNDSDKDKDKNCHTKLNGNRRHCFCIFLWLNLIVLLFIFIIFITGQYALHIKAKPIIEESNKTIIYEVFEVITAITYFYSHLCTIISCFIFSKLMYGIQRKIDQAATNNETIIGEINGANRQNKLTTLMEADNTFITGATKMLSVFQFWFFVHWVFYIITSFLVIALSIEAILLLIRATQHHIQPGVHFSGFEISLLILVSASNVIMFFYPCFQAASITRARKRYIRHLIKKYKNDNQRGVVEPFVKYLKSREFGFRLCIGCTYIPFSLNIAYISVIIGVFGIVLSVLASIAT